MKTLTHGSTDPQNPAHRLRCTFRDLSEQDYRIGRQARCAYIKIAWNAFVAGDRVDQLELPKSLAVAINPVSSSFWIDEAKVL